tara:strand:- start:345 stop:680 length:336 start_codon:yes stop_codon:yes gene_type:complete
MNNERILDTMDEEAYRELLVENKSLKKRVEEAEGEVTLIKGIGMNSPEMRAAKTRIVELEKRLASVLEINDSHQRYNSRLQTTLSEVQEDNKKLAHQVADQLDRFRKAGGL